MRRRPYQIVASLFLLAVVVAAAGCGSSKKSTTTTTTTPAATTATTTPQASPTQTQSTTPSVASSGSAALGALASAGNCKSLLSLGTAISQAMTGSGSVDVQKEAQLLEQFAQKVPSSIKPDFQIIADDVKKIADAIGTYTPGSTPSPAELAKLQSLSTSIDSTQLSKAASDISTWAAANCHA
jgi:hypothetical protein